MIKQEEESLGMEMETVKTIDSLRNDPRTSANQNKMPSSWRRRHGSWSYNNTVSLGFKESGRRILLPFCAALVISPQGLALGLAFVFDALANNAHASSSVGKIWHEFMAIRRGYREEKQENNVLPQLEVEDMSTLKFLQLSFRIGVESSWIGTARIQIVDEALQLSSNWFRSLFLPFPQLQATVELTINFPYSLWNIFQVVPIPWLLKFKI